MSDLDELLKSIPLADVAAKLGVSEDVAAQAVNQAVPTLLAGLQAQDTTQAPTNLANAADQGDGDKIVSNLFGEKTDDVAVAAAAQGSASVTDGLVKQLLPLLAPIVISFVMKKLNAGGGAAPAPQTAPAPQGGGDVLGSILGNMLGGGAAGGNAGAGNVLGSILGGLLKGK